MRGTASPFFLINAYFKRKIFVANGKYKRDYRCFFNISKTCRTLMFRLTCLYLRELRIPVLDMIQELVGVGTPPSLRFCCRQNQDLVGILYALLILSGLSSFLAQL